MNDQLIRNCREIRSLIEERINLLSMLEKEITLENKDLSKGKLHISKRGMSNVYYNRKISSDKTGEYIPKKNNHIAFELAQREYNEELDEEIKRQLYHLKCMGNLDLNDIYEKYSESKRMLISPKFISDMEYIKKWEAVEYDTRSFENVTTEYYTAKNERVRSKSECHLADTLTRFNIPYRYEYPIKVKGLGDYHPDFVCLNVRKRKEVIWEHFGMMGDEDYVNDVMYKIKCLTLAGCKMGQDFVFTMESANDPLSTKMVEKIIYEYLM